MNFNTKSITKITGLTQRRIDYWDTTHFIKPSIREATGTGSARLYAFSDLVQLKVAKTLLDKGISLQKIRKSINYLKKHMPEIDKPLAELRFLTDSETIFVLTSKKQEIIDTLNSGQIVFSIALGKILEDLQGEILKFRQDRKYSVMVAGKQYSVVLHTDAEDGGYWIECPALRGCASQGDTVEESLAMIKDAIKGHLEVVAARKKVKKAS
jgi:predicted RNase H-like HicB family nuclease